MAKKKTDPINEPELEFDKPKKKRSGAYSKQKGNRYELKLIKELGELGYDGLVSARSESRSLDNDKIDIAETIDKLPCYVQAKCKKLRLMLRR